MIILPAERKLDWKHPPWMTLGLMLACLLVFLFYQAKDPRLMGQAIGTYLDANLDELELPLYLDYLERQQLRERRRLETGWNTSGSFKARASGPGWRPRF